MYSKQNIWDLVRGFEWLEILGFTVLIYIVRLNWRWLMMHERSMKKEPWPKSHKWRCFKHFHGFKNRLAWAKTVRIFTKGGLQQLSAQAQQVSRIEQQDYTGHGKPFTMGTMYRHSSIYAVNVGTHKKNRGKRKPRKSRLLSTKWEKNRIEL